MTVNILGAEWNVEYCNADADPQLKENDGYTDPSVKLIVIANKRTDCTINDYKYMQKKIFVMRLFMHFCLRVDWALILSIANLAMKKL